MTETSAQYQAGARFLTGVIFLLPALTLAVPAGIAIMEVAALFVALVFARPLWQRRHALFESAGWIVSAFVFQFCVVAATMLWSGFSPRHLDNPAKQLLALAIVGLIVLLRPRVQVFWYGLFAGTLAAAGIALYQRFALDLPRAEGFYMAIMFGDIAIVMGVMALASISHFARRRTAFLPYAAFIAGVAASVLSGSRGGWLALALSFIPLYSYGSPVMRRKMAAIIAASAVLFAVAFFIPDLQVRQRVHDAATEVTQYHQNGKADTSVGARLEMWRGALIMFAEQPLQGVGRGKFNAGLRSLIARGEIDPAIANFRHAHNELLHVLATAGIAGGGILLFLYAAPMVFFARVVRRHDAAQPYALAGLLLVLSFIAFGLTQVLFSHHVGTAFYAMTISVLAGSCILLQRQDPVQSSAERRIDSCAMQ